jgi:hypothetical protein
MAFDMQKLSVIQQLNEWVFHLKVLDTEAMASKIHLKIAQILDECGIAGLI